MRRFRVLLWVIMITQRGGFTNLLGAQLRCAPAIINTLMQRDDWMILSLTFLTGLAIGMYVYVTVFKPTYVPETINATESGASEWSMIGKKRIEGDNSRTVHPSFRLLGDGSYTYIAGGVGEGALEQKTGKLSSALMRELRAKDAIIETYTPFMDVDYCGGDVNGFDYEYDVIINNITYVMDSCYTPLSYNTEVAVLLQKVWSEMAGNSTSRASYGSVSEFLQAWIRTNLGVNN